MRTDRHRIRAHTRHLLKYEERFQRFRAHPAEIATILRDIRGEMDPRVGSCRTSRGIDYFLQLAMLYVAMSCYRHCRFREGLEIVPEDIKVLTSVYYRNLDTVVVKPSCHFPGFCAARQPTLDLVCPRPTEEDAPGITGLTLLRGDVIHCYGESFLDCPTQFGLRDVGRSDSLLCLPLGKELRTRIDKYLSRETTGPFSETCCQRSPETRRPEPIEVPKWVYGVLGVETTNFSLDREIAKRWLQEPDLQQVLVNVAKTMKRFQKERPQYKVHRAWSALDGLRQMRPERRHALEIACFALSKLCGGADITMHLREFFPDPTRQAFRELDRKRSARLVLGIGPRVRGFLIHERYEGGLVGSVLNQAPEGDPADDLQWLSSEEIEEALETERRIRAGESNQEPDRDYRVLMRDTVLNVAVPLRFASRVIGVINIEWSLKNCPPREEQAAYVERLRPLLARAAQYICLIVDYLDDHDNPKFALSDERANEVIHQTHHQLALRHYAQTVLKNLKEPSPDSTDNFLDLVIKNVGYQVTFDNDHRILASIRRLRGETEPRTGETRSSLKIFGRPHGIDPGDDQRAKDLWIGSQDSVLLRCEQLKVPIFGSLVPGEGGQFELRPDRLCLDLMPAEDRRRMPETIPYLTAHPAKSTPIYEVGVPLMFGAECLGTFDFELFDAGVADESENAIGFRGHHLLRFLDWARFFSYFLALQEDRADPTFLSRATEEEKRDFEQLKQIIALVLFGVSTDFEVLKPIIETYLQSLVPLDDDGIQFEPSDSKTPPRVDDLEPREEGIWLGNEYLGRLDLRFTDDHVKGRPVFSRARAGSGIARKVRSQVRNLVQHIHRFVEPLEDREFIDRMELFARSLESDLTGPLLESWRDQDPAQYLRSLFSQIHTRISDALPKQGRYGWFLYSTVFGRTRENENRWFFRCGQPSKRWVSMRTREAEKIAFAMLDSATDDCSPNELREFFEGTKNTQIVESWIARHGGSKLSRDDVYRGLFEVLGSREILHPQDPEWILSKDQSDLSLTRRIATRLEEIHAIPDLNRSPFRSERVTGWFFGSESYAFIGVPIAFQGCCIGMLQIFRRRDYLTDLRFFKSEEILSLEHLKATIESNLEEQLRVVPFPKDPTPARDRESIRTLCREIGQSLANTAETVTVVQAPFVEDHDFLDRLGREYFAEGLGRKIEILSCTDKDWRADELNLADQALVFVTCPRWTKTKVLEEASEKQGIIRRLSRLIRDHRVVFFCHGGDTRALDLLPATARWQPIEFSEDSETQLGILGGVLGGGLLVRSDTAAAYRLEDLMDAGVDYTFNGERKQRLIKTLKFLKEGPQISPHWITFRELDG